MRNLDDSDEEDYRKGYLKARKQKAPKRATMEDIDFQFTEQFAMNLMKERGLEITEAELGLKKPTAPKKQVNYVLPGKATLNELEAQLLKSTDVVQTSTILKEILCIEGLEQSLVVKYSIQRMDCLVKNKQYEDCKILCDKILALKINDTERVQTMIYLSNAQAETEQLWDAHMQLLRCQAMKIENEDVQKALENNMLALTVKAQKDKKTLTLISQDLTPLPSLRGRQVLSIACGDHHALALVAGCSCSNPFDPKFECKQSLCNWGNEVVGWGENFLGQAAGTRGTFVELPTVIEYFHGKQVVGLAANRSQSLAWTSEGVYRWGHVYENVVHDKILSVKNIVQVVIGLKFFGILDMQRNVYIHGQLQTSRSTVPIIDYRKPTKLDLQDIVSIAAGDNHLLALDDEGTVYTFGSNEYGQLGKRPSEGIFQQKLNTLQESAFQINANQNLSLLLNLDGELLYMGELTELKHVDFLKSAQLPPDITIIQAQSQNGCLYALTDEGHVYKWDADREPRFKLFEKGPIREMQIGKTLKIYRNSYLRGSYCSLQIKPDDEGNEPPLATYEDIKLNLNLKDECGDYALNFTHPVRLHYFAELKPSKNKKEILDVSQISTLKQNRSKQDCQVYPFRLFECDKLIKFEYSDQEITLQFSESGVYTFWLLLNEEFVLGAPLKLTIIKSEKEEELAKKQQELNEARRMLEEEQINRRKEQEELKRKRQQEEQAQIEQRQRETQQRAEEALRQHNLKKQEEQLKLEQERQLKKDLLIGGGFDLEKANQLKQQKIQAQQPVTQQPLQPQNIQTQQQPRIQSQNTQNVVKPVVQRASQPRVEPQVQKPAQRQAIDFKPKQQQQNQPQAQPQQPIKQVTTLAQEQKKYEWNPSQNNSNIPKSPQQSQQQQLQLTQQPKAFQIRPGDRQRIAQSQPRTTQPTQPSSRQGQRPVLPNLQRSALQQPTQAMVPRRAVNSVQQTQRLTQTQTNFPSRQNQNQDLMSRTETKMTNPQVQNLVDPFQLQQSRGPTQSRARVIKR